ncbi:MAG: hypothetical protein FJ104_15420 [Deltaproteobacteria bacterium]|nr:hypothetical protein [Deltaproteobacteria bacterium]
MDGKAWLAPLVDDEVFVVRVRLRVEDVVYVKSVLEASDGLGAILAPPRERGTPPSARGGDVAIAAPASRRKELLALLRDLQEELGGALWTDPGALRE